MNRQFAVMVSRLLLIMIPTISVVASPIPKNTKMRLKMRLGIVDFLIESANCFVDKV